MSPLAAVASILLAVLLGAMSPGPSFVLVARNSIGLSRRDGVATALGMGSGAICFAHRARCSRHCLSDAVSRCRLTARKMRRDLSIAMT